MSDTESIDQHLCFSSELAFDRVAHVNRLFGGVEDLFDLALADLLSKAVMTTRKLIDPTKVDRQVRYGILVHRFLTSTIPI